LILAGGGAAVGKRTHQEHRLIEIQKHAQTGEPVMAEDAEFVDLTLGIQADIFIDLAAAFARLNRIAAAEAIRNIEDKIARDLTERAIDLGARSLSAKGIAQVAGYLADTIEEARQKMAESENKSRRASGGGILAHILKFFVELKERVAKLHFATGASAGATRSVARQ
jgi:hypothetical protein